MPDYHDVMGRPGLSDGHYCEPATIERGPEPETSVVDSYVFGYLQGDAWSTTTSIIDDLLHRVGNGNLTDEQAEEIAKRLDLLG